MKNKLTDNLILKVGSVLFAIILWLLVTNINDPSTSKRFTNIPVKIINADLITGQGKIYEVLDTTDVIDSVVVWAPRSIVNTISTENIVAIADMRDLTNLNTIEVKLSTNQYYDKIDSIGGNIEKVELNIEDKEQIALPLKSVSSGTLENGYIVGDITPEQNLVTISGPKSVVSEISEAQIDVNVTGFTSDIGTNVDIKLYDIEGKEIKKDRLTLNINSVGVKVEILASKQIGLKYTAMGIPAAGYRATGVISSTPDSVLLAGKSNTLKNLTVIEIPETALDITGLSENLVTTLELKEYLPGNLEFSDTAFDGNATVTVFIEPEVTRNIMLSKDDLSAVNVPEGYEAIVSGYDVEFPVQVRGLAQNINSMDATLIKGTVDVESLVENNIIGAIEEGFYDVPLSLNLPENIELKEKVTVRLTIRAAD